MAEAAAELVRHASAPSVQFAEDGRRIYQPDGVTLAAFLFDRSEIAIARGPWGSGTSSACCQRIWQHATEQNVGSDGMQKSRWFVMRDTYPKLETTTLETFMYWFPERLYGKLFTGKKPFLYEIRVGRIVLDVWFGAYSDLGGDSIFLSLEPTGWWWNELEDIAREPFFAGHGRVGRMPPVIEGGSKWSGTIADLNAPPEHHWLPMMMGEVEVPDDMTADERAAFKRPPGMAYFVQPPAVLPERDIKGRITGFNLNTKAENLKWLRHVSDPPEQPGKRYYERAMIGKSHRWIRKNLGNEILPLVEGDPVWPMFDDQVHVSPEPLRPMEGVDVWGGLDFGRRPALVLGQTVGRQHQVQFEMRMLGVSAAIFAPEARKLIAHAYPWVLEGKAELRLWGDPKGEDGQQNDERTAYDVFRANGLMVRAAPVKQNNIQTRLDVVAVALEQMRLLVSKTCRRLIMGMAGGYRFPKERPSPMTDPKPIKDPHSDLPDALQYAMLGEGEGRAMIGQPHRSSAVVIRAPRGQRRFAGARRPF